jgi:exopolysaccharide biosynthesis polyprenyl glycosylphosphotransferase
MESGTARQLPIVHRLRQQGRAPSRGLRLARSEARWKDALRRRMLAAADVTAVLIGGGLAGAVEAGGVATSLWTAALVPVWVLMAKGSRLYDRDHVRIRHQTIDEIVGLLRWATLSVALTAFALALLPGDLLSAGGALAMWLGAFTGAVVLRTMARALWRRLVPAERGLIVGSGEVADAVARKLVLEPGHHLSLATRVRLDPRGTANGAAPPTGRRDWQHLTSIAQLEEVVREGGIERVVVAVQDLDEQTLAPLVSACRFAGVKLSVAPPLQAMLGTAVELNHLAELPLIEFRTWDPSRSTMLIKRAIDVVGSALALTMLAPLLIVIAIVIRLDSRGPAFFRQLRAGQQGEPFRMVKFRTMVRDAEERIGEVVNVEELAEPVFKLRGDPRVTRVGRFLRRTSLDELPQLWNVLRGDMSLVGPRPEEAWLVERYEEAERARLEMRPGMTGAMQVHGRGELTFQERLAVEREYVENYSLPKDIELLLRTLFTVFRGRGAF